MRPYALDVQPWLPGTAFRQGREDAQDRQLRNSLARQQSENQTRNALAYERNSQDQHSAFLQSQQAQKAELARQWMGNAVEHGRRNPALVPKIIQDGMQQGFLDDSDAQDISSGGIESFALRHGIAPAQQAIETIGDTAHPERGIYQKDPTTGELKQVTAPHYAPEGGGGYSMNAQSGINPTTGKPDQFVLDKHGHIKWLNIGANPAADRADQKAIQQMRKEFDNLQEVKDFKTQLPILLSARKAPNTRAGDVDLIYALGKIFDPNSVVREGELKLAQGVAPWLVNMVTQAQSQISGTGRLSPATRADILKTLNNRVMQARQSYTGAYQRFADYAGKAGYAPQDVVGRHFANIMREQNPNAAPTQADNDPLGIR